jgi:hypothetical protein
VVHQSTYLCTSPAAEPNDCHRSTTAVSRPNSSRKRGFLTICMTCREGGNRDFATFHEYPLPTNISIGEPLPVCTFSSSSPLACDMRTDTLRSRRLSVLLRFRCTCRVDNFEGGESRVAVGAPERGRGGATVLDKVRATAEGPRYGGEGGQMARRVSLNRLR